MPNPPEPLPAGSRQIGPLRVIVEASPSPGPECSAPGLFFRNIRDQPPLSDQDQASPAGLVTVPAGRAAQMQAQKTAR